MGCRPAFFLSMPGCLQYAMRWTRRLKTFFDKSYRVFMISVLNLTLILHLPVHPRYWKGATYHVLCFKSMLEIFTGIYPTEWKLARVTPKSDIKNYRPDFVIPVVSKVLEKLVYNQLHHYLNDNKLLSSCQSGFRSLHSTFTALLEATNSWSVNIDNGLMNGVVFIDLKKAFNTIDHEITLRKMSYFGADQASFTWFQSYLCNRTQIWNINGRL